MRRAEMHQPILRRPSSIALTIALGALGATGALPMAIGQGEQQRPQEQRVEIAATINADDAWTCRFRLNQVTTTQRQTEDRGNDGPPETTRLIQDATMALRVVSVDEQSGTATIEARFDRLHVIIGPKTNQSEFLHPRESQQEPPRTSLDSLLTALAGSTFTARVSPSGAVRGVVGYEGLNAMIETEPEVDRSALGLFAHSVIGSTLEMIWKPGAISGATRGLHDHWTDTRLASLGQVGGVAIEQSIGIDRIEDGFLAASGEIDLRLLAPTDPPRAGVPTIELISHEGGVKIAWDLSRGCSSSVSENLDVTANWILGPARLGVSMRTERAATINTQ